MGHELSSTLKERGNRYGEFSRIAEKVQEMEDILLAGYNNDCPSVRARVRPVHREAIHMILHKLARIAEGDPEYADNWHDIAGFAKLAEDRCISPVAPPMPPST